MATIAGPLKLELARQQPRLYLENNHAEMTLIGRADGVRSTMANSTVSTRPGFQTPVFESDWPHIASATLWASGILHE